MFLNILKIRENKNKILALSLIAIFAFSLSMTFAQPALAQVGVVMPEKTVGFASVAPTLIGVGQAPTVNLWVYPLPTTYAYLPYFKGFSGLTVTFVRPDGTQDTFMPTDDTGQYVAGETQSLGALFFTHYVPNMVGNWSVSFTLPAQNLTDSSGTVQFLGCTSNTAYFTVQAGTVLAGLLNGYPWAQLPNSNVYWSYPINANNREWNQISGDWTGMANTMAMVNSPTQLRWQPYGSGPNTAHIVWDQPYKAGGIIGGVYGSYSYAAGQSSTSGVNSPVITEGKVFTNIPLTSSGASATPYGQAFGIFRCYDLSTGQVLYTANGSITYGIHLPGNAFTQNTNQNQVELASSYGSDYGSYLFGTATVAGIAYWNYYDPMTGILTKQFSNVSAARLIDGTELAFGAGALAGSTTRYVYRWNMTSVASNNNWQTGITWKVPLPTPLSSGPTTPTIFAVSSDLSTIVVYNYAQYWAYDANTGASLWNLTLNFQVNTNQELQLAQVDDFIVWNPTDSAWNAYSIKTGALLWETPSVASYPWASSWTIYFAETNDLNNVYFSCPDGAMRAYSLTDGHLIWTSTPIPSTEDTENVLPLVVAGTVMVGGNIYVYAGYSLSYQINPVPRFSEMLCINATTGDTIYTLNGGIVPNGASNGYLTASSIFDGNFYCLGKGQTSTSVGIQNDVVTNGVTVLIKGNVLDQSPAQPGTPAVSDASQSEQMDYLHMQNSTLLNSPPQETGVPVTLTSVDPNGNFVTIGTTTTDSSGNYAINFVPSTVGIYKIDATFGGSNAYYPSYSETALSVTSAHAETATPTQTNAPSNLATTSDLMTYIVAVGIAIIIAIAIATVLILRKRA